MSKKRVNKCYKVSTSEQLIIILKESKYTYGHLTDFHKTVLQLLENNDLSRLSRGQMKNTSFFISIVIGLLDSPKMIDLYAHRGKTERQEEDIIEDEGVNAIETDLVGPQKKVRKKDRVSAANFKELLCWIDEVVQLKEITIEALLDQFYHLSFIRQRQKE